jgi:hypothetical protein
MQTTATSVVLRRCITGAVVSVGIYDVVVGLYLLASSTPWLAHGPGTAWVALGAQLVDAMPPDATLGLFRRMGAFSLHAGVCTIVWAILGHRRPALQTALFLTYAVTGAGFAITDAAFFPDTPYRIAKHIIGTIFFVALLAHFWQRRREAVKE